MKLLILITLISVVYTAADFQWTSSKNGYAMTAYGGAQEGGSKTVLSACNKGTIRACFQFTGGCSKGGSVYLMQSGSKWSVRLVDGFDPSHFPSSISQCFPLDAMDLKARVSDLTSYGSYFLRFQQGSDFVRDSGFFSIDVECSPTSTTYTVNPTNGDNNNYGGDNNGGKGGNGDSNDSKGGDIPDNNNDGTTNTTNPNNPIDDGSDYPVKQASTNNDNGKLKVIMTLFLLLPLSLLLLSSS